MRRYLRWLALVPSLCLFAAQQSNAQISNGDFETQASAPPTVERNIKGGSADELPNWSLLTATGGTVAINASFLATNASPTSPVNPQNTSYPYFGGPFTPHSGIGCIDVKREPGQFTYDGLVAQAVSVTAGHTYQASFYALRRPVGQTKAKLALSIVNSATLPSFDGATNVNAISPAPYAVIASDFITSDQQWTLVSGSFVASSTGTNWFVVGYTRDAEQYDASLNNSIGNDKITYAIDDVSLTDMGCAPVPKASNRGFVRVGGSCYYDYQIDPVPNATSYSVQLSNGDTGTGYINGTTGGYVRFGLMEVGPATVNVTVTVTNSCGSSTTTFTNRAIPAPPKNCFYRALATPSAAQLEGLSAYPSPATTSLMVEVDPTLKVALVQVLNMTGQQVLSMSVDSNTFLLKTEALSTGLYLLRVSTSNGVLTKRIQVTAP